VNQPNAYVEIELGTDQTAIHPLVES
jgi:hypothetical protein